MDVYVRTSTNMPYRINFVNLGTVPGWVQVRGWMAMDGYGWRVLLGTVLSACYIHISIYDGRNEERGSRRRACILVSKALSLVF